MHSPTAWLHVSSKFCPRAPAGSRAQVKKQVASTSAEKAEDIIDKGIVFANKFLCVCLALLNKNLEKLTAVII